MELDLDQGRKNENLRKLRRILDDLEEYDPATQKFSDEWMMDTMDFFNDIRRAFENFRNVENPTGCSAITENCEIAETTAKTIEECLGPDDDDELVMILKIFFTAVESIVQGIIAPDVDIAMDETIDALTIPTL
uniref:Uncharacterized protein n=1 Tax=viral metagenome TaxID=1070528 RepID=A0A6C0AJM7_9ZZZZ